MSNYFSLRITAAPKRILYVDDEHNIVEIAVVVARDMALHGFLDESAMVVAPIWNSAIHGHRDFSLDFVRDTISHFGLDLIWRSANFTPLGFDTWESRFDRLGLTDELIEMEQRVYFCSAGSDVTYDSYLDASLAHSSWPVIRSMLAVWEDPNTHKLLFPANEIELEALGRLEAYIGQDLPASPDLQEWRPCVLGLELSLKYGKHKLAYEFLNTIAAQLASGGPGTSPLVRDLALTPRIGYIVCSSPILRYATGFTRCRAQEIAFEVVQALDSRFRWGEARPHAGLSWINLLSEIEILESRIWDEELESDLPFFRPPASPQRIARVELELEATLPQDYKEFLAVSNGLGSFSRSQVTPLLSVEDVYWDEEHDTLKVEYRRFDSNPDIAQLPFLHRVLQVSDVDDDEDTHWWFIEPALIQQAKWSVGEDGPAEWLGVNYAEWQPKLTNRGSFRIMMERRLSDLMNEGHT
ncbi:unnamed protein product [Rhizoctonia solani]|uniref:Knr4/Smi1-like domain-containing protein n=1 Tax=Rhizoctonia solani TaxID=456999 RepID=A0A8H3AWP0_9AGAM|nr:unnamed protein product [Rhizoctonia solani]CAE6445562.1 unnamed protein product [Rhizoctonia solani]